MRASPTGGIDPHGEAHAAGRSAALPEGDHAHVGALVRHAVPLSHFAEMPRGGTSPRSSAPTSTCPTSARASDHCERADRAVRRRSRSDRVRDVDERTAAHAGRARRLAHAARAGRGRAVAPRLAAARAPRGARGSTTPPSSSDGTELLVRWYDPSPDRELGPAAVFLHGGGMILGSVAMYDRLVAGYVADSGVPFLSVDYRVAPEHPHPTPVEDCLRRRCSGWSSTPTSSGVDPARVAVMGDSAGGGLAAGVALLARDRGVALARQMLVYPMLDDRTTVPDPELAPFAAWSYDDNYTGWHALLGDAVGDPTCPPPRRPRVRPTCRDSRDVHRHRRPRHLPRRVHRVRAPHRRRPARRSSSTSTRAARTGSTASPACRSPSARSPTASACSRPLTRRSAKVRVFTACGESAHCGVDVGSGARGGSIAWTASIGSTASAVLSSR